MRSLVLLVGHDVLQKLKNQSLYHEILLKKTLMTEEGRFSKKQPQTGSFLSILIVSDCMVYPDHKFLISNFRYFLNTHQKLMRYPLKLSKQIRQITKARKRAKEQKLRDSGL